MEELVAPEWGDHDRSCEPCAENADLSVDPGDIVEHARTQAQPAPGRDICPQRDLVIRPRHREGVGAGRQFDAGLLLERVEIGAIQVSVLLPIARLQATSGIATRSAYIVL
jgi:hypothetical protein